ncbi:MAG: PspC domain-containing protein [Chloroflexi bacterium]|jgi:phage shock protein C|nr:PspC domain-containing protein [Chloroflexota bacterium]NMC45937.1 PspC domain-containing protein [Chloroflexota bacterium]HOJ01979.1 PspC domain-containing protein [Anaerolineaceae bacterium]
MSDNVHKLYRSRDSRMIAGVCGGLGEFMGVDPTIVRLLFVLGLFLGTLTFWVYLVMMLVIPEEP